MKHSILIERFNFPSKVKALYIVLLGIFLSQHIFCQDNNALRNANAAFSKGSFSEALIYYNQVEKVNVSAPLLFKRGICHFETNQLDRAKGDFQRSWEFGYHNKEVDFYMGQINHHKGFFDEASNFYKRYLLSLPKLDKKRIEVRKLIRQCGNAIDLALKTPIAIVENPADLNSRFNERRLMESPTRGDKYYFVSDRLHDGIGLSSEIFHLFSVMKKGQVWSPAEKLPFFNGSSESIALLGFTGDGLGMYYGVLNSDNPNVFLRVSGKTGSFSESIKIPSTWHSEKDGYQLHNEAFLFFSSRSLKGYGGSDLYYTCYSSEGWRDPVNMGPEINGPSDEISPYISNDGMVLYFSSNRDLSIGGFDIFKSAYQMEAGKWSQPKNLAIPINSPGDEFDFRLSENGVKAFFSSNRKNAKGGTDVYIARFKGKQEGQDYLVKALTFCQDCEDYTAIYKYRDHNSDSLRLVNLSQESGLDDKMIRSVESLESGMTVFEYSPVYYTSGKDLLTEKNRIQLDSLVSFLMDYPEVKLEIVSNSNFDGILEYNLFMSLKIGEKVKSFIEKKGIDKSRLYVKGLGNNYPLMKTELISRKDQMSVDFNSRVDFRFHDYEDYPIILDKRDPSIDPLVKDSRYDIYETLIENEVTYKIQIAMVNQMYRGVVLDLFNDASIEEHMTTGLYAYTIGLYDNYASALQIKRSLEREGMTDVKVIPYIDGIRISDDDLVYFVNEYPDLKNAMNYGN